MLPGPIIVHSLDEARLALAAAGELGVGLTLASAPGAGAYAGPAWFGAVIAAAREEHPHVALSAILDCADARGPALAALRWAKTAQPVAFALCFTGDEATTGKLAEMATALGVGFLRAMPTTLDLHRARDPAAACRDWLTGVAATP